ncbi:MAG TPA: sigma-70 family RNA polymerase sigma factor [Bryobacteraceae bacterium]|nr:sigma-70 family RNA polymerase sigma factor [Bryobacteraceae bacterium]
MPSSAAGEATRLLQSWSKGNTRALDRLIPLVYDELHSLAAQYLRRERPGHTLQPTALVNEAYLRLVDQRDVQWQSRAHFMGVAARMMRRILVDHARRRGRVKRGSGKQVVSLDEALTLTDEKVGGLIALDEALTALSAFDARKGRVVELRYFGGLSNDEMAEVLQVSTMTVMRDWKLAKAWLYQQVTRNAADGL